MTDYSELVKALQWCAKPIPCSKTECPRKNTDEDCACHVLHDAAAAIEELQAYNKELSEELIEAQAKSHWISADIPPKNPNEGVRAEFLVCLENGCVRTLLYEFGYSAPDGYAPLFDEGWHKTWRPVKYWMPLPEPPQEVQDGTA